ncbi:hypothetical protein ON010_g11255 [Phytophthora cinnamomi]|nr:hypothetical protein ON010_g11255 [Phytophthora cinnamomi]
MGLKPIEGKRISLVTDVAIAKDDLVAQYVGEVLSREMYANRERAEARRSQNTYGMVVTDKEVIDARYVGGMARFANHSCEPNCNVERWEVAGETCCGLFANRAIERGEEITISYGFKLSTDKVRQTTLAKLLATNYLTISTAGEDQVLVRLF